MFEIALDETGSPCTGVCTPWAGAGDVPPSMDTSGIDSATLTSALEFASDVLFRLSGRQYSGSCAATIRPSAKTVTVDGGRPIRSGVGYWPWGSGVGWYGGPWQGAGSAFGWCLCNRSDRTGCYTVPEMPLGAYPVTAVTEVLIDGAVLDPSAYRVDENRWLVRTDGGEWPCCQRVELPPTEPGTWQVSMNYGLLPDRSGVIAAAVLGYELALAWTPPRADECRLPRRVTSITRQGISAVVLDPLAYIDKGRTGLEEVDLFLHAVNPTGASRPATVWRPGQRNHRFVH